MYNLPGFNYLENPDRSTAQSIYNGDHFEVFNTNEFEYKVRPIDWVTTNIVKNSIMMLSNMIALNAVTFDFGNDAQNKYIQTFLNKNGYKELKYAGIDDLAFGDGFIQLAVEDNPYTRSVDYMLKSYALDPQAVYLEYDEFNPSRGVTAYSITFEKEIEKNKAVLVITYKPGIIEYVAFIDVELKKPKQVDPREYFRDFFSDDLSYTQDGLMYILDLELEYSALVHLQGSRDRSSAYGDALVNDPVASKVQLLERMYNLADYAVTDKAKPQRQLSKATSRILKGAIASAQKDDNYTVTQLPMSFTQPVTSKRSVTYEMSQIAQMMGQSLVYYEDDGQGENKYIVNPSTLEDLYELIDRVKKDIYTELYISEALWNPELTSGNLSGSALKRLMAQTTDFVEDRREAYIPVLKRYAFTALQLAVNSNAVQLPEPTDLPDVTFKPLNVETIEDTIKKYQTALSIKQSPELRDKAVSVLIDKELNEVQAMSGAQTLRETLTQRLNGGSNTN